MSKCNQIKPDLCESKYDTYCSTTKSGASKGNCRKKTGGPVLENVFDEDIIGYSKAFVKPQRSLNVFVKPQIAPNVVVQTQRAPNVVVKKQRSYNVVVQPQRVRNVDTTLELVSKVWGSVNAVQIAKQIDSLESDTNLSIRRLILNSAINSKLEKEINESQIEKDVYLDRYERMTTPEFIELLEISKIDGLALKHVLLDNIEKGSKGLLEEIENAVLGGLESRKNNSSMVYLTSKNVKTSEFIKEAGISSFDSILRSFEKFDVLHKNSVSNTIVFNAHFKLKPSNSFNPLRESNIPDSPFYFKIYPKKILNDSVVLEIQNDGLDFEQYAYNQLFKLAKYNVTPNILCKVLTARLPGFDNFLEKLPKDKMTKFIEEKKEITDKKWLETGVIITQPGGKTFMDSFEYLESDKKRSVLFQILYTLYVFEKIEFSHGDLHLGNIFILDVPENELCYIVEGVQYRFKTTKLVKIYDFDHGTICKSTQIRLNRDDSFTIDKMLNKKRNTDRTLNTEYGETNIFNKNLDMLIFTNRLARTSFIFMNHLQLSPENNEINDFFRECFPGFDSKNPLSTSKISTVYTSLLNDDSQRKEANRIFGIEINRRYEYFKYKVEPYVLNMTWMQYFENIKSMVSRIVKNFNDNVPNNHLWIPDSVVLPRNMMLANRYFDVLKSDKPIDIRKIAVYSIDNRIMNE